MKFDFKQTAGASFLVGLIAASFIWLLFGWALCTFHYAPVFKSINYYGLITWFKGDLPWLAPLIPFWFLILLIIVLLWLVCLSARVISFLKAPTEQPVYRGALCAIYALAALLIIFHIADICTSSRVNNVALAQEGTVTFKNGLELSLGELNYTSGNQYLNLPISVEPHNILRSDWDIAANTAIIGIKSPGSGIVYAQAYLTKPFQHNGVNVVIEKFYSEDNILEPAGVWVTVTKKPLLPFLLAVYLLLSAAVLVLIIAPRLDKAAQPKIEPAPKLPPKMTGTTSIAKAKKKNKK